MRAQRDNTQSTVRLAAILLTAGALLLPTLCGAAAAAVEKPYVVEWVYKVKWGHSDEFFDIFKKYQIPILDRLKELGYVAQYTVYRPSLHTGEDERFDYTVLIVYRNQAGSTHESEVEHRPSCA